MWYRKLEPNDGATRDSSIDSIDWIDARERGEGGKRTRAEPRPACSGRTETAAVVRSVRVAPRRLPHRERFRGRDVSDLPRRHSLIRHRRSVPRSHFMQTVARSPHHHENGTIRSMRVKAPDTLCTTRQTRHDTTRPSWIHPPVPVPARFFVSSSEQRRGHT